METKKIEIIKNGNMNVSNIVSEGINNNGIGKNQKFNPGDMSKIVQKPYDIYMAGPLFTAAEIEFNLKLCAKLTKHGLKVFLPQEKCAGETNLNAIYHICRSGILSSKIVLANMDGSDADSGTCWECGFASGNTIPVISYRTDFRMSGDTKGFNAMLYFGSQVVIEESKDYVKKILEVCDKQLNVIKK